MPRVLYLQKERKGKGNIAVPAYEGSLAEALKEMPATKPDLSSELEEKTKNVLTKEGCPLDFFNKKMWG
eukprot:1159885-Pelagomonas_calceolata.AAC.6